MRKSAAVILSLILSSASLWATSSTQEGPKTARQALMEMFFSKEPGTFLKHLPAVTRATLEKSGALATVQQYSVLAGQFQTQGKSFQTFETGPVMLATEDLKTGQKTEIVVDNDSLQGDQDDIEAAVRKILAAETTYAASYPAVGYTCTLSDLDGFGAAEANEHQAMLISSSLASGKHLGYIFSLSGCAGTPAASFRLTTAPMGNSYGRRAFCSDQSGAIRSSADGSAATCLSSGTPVP